MGGVCNGSSKIFEYGRSQAVRLLKNLRFNADKVVVQQLGETVLLVFRKHLGRSFVDGLEGFTSDIFEDGREQECF